jgi:predicted dehydrogenase
MVPAFRRDPRCEVVALCSASEESAKKYAAALSIARAFSNYSDMLSQMPLDAVAIAVPPSAQADIVLAAVSAGVGVLAEKPLATSLSLAKTMLVRAQAAGIVHCVDFLFPELETWQQARSLVASGALGRLRHIMLDWRFESYDNAHRKSQWKTSAADGGGVLSHFGSHALYNIEWLVGPIASLNAQLDRASDLEARGDTLATMAIRLVDGASGSISLCNAAVHGSGHRIEIYGESGALVLENRTMDPVVGFHLAHGSRGKNLEFVAEEKPNARESGEDHRVAPLSRLVRRFLDAVLTGSQVRPSFEDGARVQTLLDAARTSFAGGGLVTTL